MNCIVKVDNYDGLYKENKLSIFLRDFVVTRIKLREDFASNKDAFIDGKPLELSVLDRLFDDNFDITNLALVHVTDKFPDGGIIECAQNRVLDYYNSPIKIQQHRHTTHFALNGRVGNNDGGSWDGGKIVIIEPLVNHIDDIININPADTYFLGDFKLSNKALILVHESIYETIPQELFSNYNVVKFNGSNTIAVEKMLLIMGYKPQTVGSTDWVNTKNTEILKQYFMRNYPQIRNKVHHLSEEQKLEKNLQERDFNLSEIRGVEFIDTSKGLSDISIDELKQLWKKYCDSHYGNNIYDFNQFFNYCFQSGIMVNEDKKISFYSDLDIIKNLKNRETFLKDNIYNYQLIFEEFMLDTFFDYIFYPKGMEKILKNIFEFWYDDNHDLQANNCSKEEVENAIKVYMRYICINNVFSQYMFQNKYYIRPDDVLFKYPNEEMLKDKKHITIGFDKNLAEVELDKRIDDFIQKQNRNIIRIIDYVCNESGGESLNSYLNSVYVNRCNHLGNLDSEISENAARKILSFQVKGLFEKYKKTYSPNYVIHYENNTVIEINPNVLDYTLDTIISDFIVSKKNVDKHVL